MPEEQFAYRVSIDPHDSLDLNLAGFSAARVLISRKCQADYREESGTLTADREIDPDTMHLLYSRGIQLSRVNLGA